ncbi:MAG: DUF4837 family protein [Parabacteroides sp.]|nr:DUF4837 family protein [Parabacteroides sp.]
MKKISLLISLFMFLVLLEACSSGPVGKRATGLAYEVVVVMKKANWDGPSGKAVKQELTSDVPGLPQSEPALKITYVDPSQFDGLLTYARNILIVNIDPSIYTKVSVTYEKDRWAKGQVVVNLNAPSAEELEAYIHEYPKTLVDFFVKAEMNRAIGQLQKDYSTVVMDNLKNNHDLMLNAPANMTYYRDTTDFFWASNNANTGRTDLIVYTFPYTDPNTFTAEYLIAKRDSVLKENLPGAFSESHMATETRAEVTYTPITVNGQYCGVMRGLWKMVGDMMGGPFVSHVRLDEKNNRVVVAEGFVFAPETDKRNFIRRIEAALYTLRLPGEFDKPVEEKMDIPESKK